MKNLGLALFLVTFGLFARAAQEDSCVSCHSTVEGVSYVEHNFKDWEKSIHARANVSCTACHGGQSQEADKKAAHKGLLSSRDPRSPVYFTQVPATCGTCHRPEIEAFQKSAHFKELKRSGRGPNCVTCHGSMANHILAPRELEMACTLCHRQPTNAFATLLALTNAQTTVDKLDKAIQLAEQKKTDVTQQKENLEQILNLYNKALVDWHTFEMKKVLKSAQKITQKAREALTELQFKEVQQP